MAKPSKGTKADQRLKDNNPQAGKKPAPAKSAKPMPPQKGGKC